MKMEKIIPALVLTLSSLVMLVYLLPGLVLLKPFVMLVFMALGPGLGWMPLLKLPGLTQIITLGIALSLGLAALVALIFLYAGAWSIEWMLVVLLVIALCGAFYQLLGLAKSRDRTAKAVQVATPEDSSTIPAKGGDTTANRVVLG